MLLPSGHSPSGGSLGAGNHRGPCLFSAHCSVEIGRQPPWGGLTAVVHPPPVCSPQEAGGRLPEGQQAGHGWGWGGLVSPLPGSGLGHCGLDGVFLTVGICGPGRHDDRLPWSADLHVGITKRLKTVEVQEGESCSFECVLSHENTSDTAVWTVGGKTVGSSGRFQATRQGRKYTLAVRDAVLSDTGEVVFSVQCLTSKASLIVRGGHPWLGRDRVSPWWGLLGGDLGQPPGSVPGDCLLQPLMGPRDTYLGTGGFWSSGDSLSRLRF